MNETYVSTLEANGMVFSSQSLDGHYRSFEVKTHPFFVGTLFQPALTSTADQPNPVIVEFIKKSINC